MTERLATMAMMSTAENSDSATVSDESLVEALRDGDATAGDQLVRRYVKSLLRYLQRVTGSDQLAEEIYQQTWLSVIEHLGRFRPADRGGFRAWLFRIATNKANDVWRSAKRDRLGLTVVSQLPVAQPAEASADAEASEQRQKLLWALTQLPEAQRQVVMLRYYSGLKFVEIAELLGCPLNTALGRMHKATVKLRVLLEQPTGAVPAVPEIGDDHGNE